MSFSVILVKFLRHVIFYLDQENGKLIFRVFFRETLFQHLVDHCEKHVNDNNNSGNTEMIKVVSQLHAVLKQLTSSNETYSDMAIYSIPRVNSQGKMKLHRCKQCNFVATRKLDFWQHIRVHIRSDKLLDCNECPFVTEFKHHLEYHMYNHSGQKPFRCSKCSYCCVNKSMLNSHLKSHSNVYQFRCADCIYVSKYCHSLKLHLRKYGHRPGEVLNPDGTPNSNIIDVYGTRRGPRSRPRQTAIRASNRTASQSVRQSSTSQSNDKDDVRLDAITSPQQSIVFPSVVPVIGIETNAANVIVESQCDANQNAIPTYSQLLAVMNCIERHKNGTFRTEETRSTSTVTTMSNNVGVVMDEQVDEQTAVCLTVSDLGNTVKHQADVTQLEASDLSMSSFRMNTDEDTPVSTPLDLTKSSTSQNCRQESDNCPQQSDRTTKATNRRRKGIAVKLEHRLVVDDTDEETAQNEPTSYSESLPSTSSGFYGLGTNSYNQTETAMPAACPPVSEFFCAYCLITFRNEGMFMIHMSYHDYQDPYKCNVCSKQCNDSMTFYSHINSRTEHT